MPPTTPRAPAPEPGSLREIVSLAWPQVLMLSAQFLVALADITAAGHISGRAQAALGMISASLFFFLVVATAMTNGAVAVMSQALGGGLSGRAGRYSFFVPGLGLALGLAFSLACVLFHAPFLRVINVPGEIRPVAGYFLRVYAYTLPAYYLLLTTNGVFQAYGKVRLPLYSMCLVTAVNGVLDFGLGLGLWGLPALGHKGVAWATFCSVSAGAAANLVNMRRSGLLKAAYRPPLNWMRRAASPLFRCAWPAGASQVLTQGSLLALFALIGTLDADPVGPLAGLAAGMRVEAVLFMPAFALNLTAAILVGRALGMGRGDLALASTLRILALGTLALGLCAALVWQVRAPLATLVAPDPAVRQNTLAYLAYSLSATPFTVAALILTGAMAGAGAAFYNMVSSGVAGWLLRLPLAWLLGRWFGPPGVWCALFISQACHGLLMLYILLRRDWQRFAMRAKRDARRT